MRAIRLRQLAAVCRTPSVDETRPPCLQCRIFPATALSFDSPSYKSLRRGLHGDPSRDGVFSRHYLNDPSEIAAARLGRCAASVFPSGGPRR